MPFRQVPPGVARDVALSREGDGGGDEAVGIGGAHAGCHVVACGGWIIEICTACYVVEGMAVERVAGKQGIEHGIEEAKVVLAMCQRVLVRQGDHRRPHGSGRRGSADFYEGAV